MLMQRNQPESPPDMRKAAVPPVITVSHDVYDKILLAEQVFVVAEGKGERPVGPAAGALLADLFSVRRCLLINGADAGPPPSRSGLMHGMVGG
jgi:hypothetical protein